MIVYHDKFHFRGSLSLRQFSILNNDSNNCQIAFKNYLLVMCSFFLFFSFSKNVKVNSTVPIASEVFKKAGVYDPGR